MMLEDLRTTIVAIEKKLNEMGIHFDIARKEEKIAELDIKWVSLHSGIIQNRHKK